MIPHYATCDKECEQCGSMIYVGYEALFLDGEYFCEKWCLAEYLVEESGAKEIYLTSDKLEMEGME